MAGDRRLAVSALPNFNSSARPRALAGETLTLESTLGDLVKQAYGLTPAENDLIWQTAPPRTLIPPPHCSQPAEQAAVEGLAPEAS